MPYSTCIAISAHTYTHISIHTRTQAVAQAAAGTAHINNVMYNLLDGEPLKKSVPSRTAIVRAAHHLRDDGKEGFVIGNDGSLFSDQEATPKRAMHIDLMHPTNVEEAKPQALAQVSWRNNQRIGGKEERQEVENFFDRRAA